MLHVVNEVPLGAFFRRVVVVRRSQRVLADDIGGLEWVMRPVSWLDLSQVIFLPPSPFLFLADLQQQLLTINLLLPSFLCLLKLAFVAHHYRGINQRPPLAYE